MLNQFSRTQLLLGQEGMERLYRARVAVFGIGGVGGYTVEALARSGIGTLDLVDDDKICLTNINRQIFATRKTVGQYKVDVAQQRIGEINPDAVVHTYKTFYTPQTAEQFDFTQYDYIVDAIDTVIGKLALVEQAHIAHTPYSKEPAITPVDDMTISCRAHCVCPPGTARKCTQRRQVPGSNAFVPAAAGLIIAGEVVKDLSQSQISGCLLS